MCERESVCEREGALNLRVTQHPPPAARGECVCVSERARERERESVCDRERESLGERERE